MLGLNTFPSSYRHHSDDRTWQQRIHRIRENWEPLLPALASGYLVWKYKGPVPSTSEHSSPSPSSTSTPSPDDGSGNFSIPVIDIYTLASTVHITRGTDSISPLDALILHGYLGNSPISPNVAVSVKTLELFRRLRLRKASFSVEAFAKVICDLYSVRRVLLSTCKHSFPYRYAIGVGTALCLVTHLTRISPFSELWTNRCSRRSAVTVPIGECKMRARHAPIKYV